MTVGISDKISLPKGTYGIDFDFTVYNNDGTAHSLTDLTITLKVWKSGLPGTLLVDAGCTIDVAASGTCHYTIQDGDFDDVGLYLYELELTKASYRDNTDPASLTVTESG